MSLYIRFRRLVMCWWGGCGGTVARDEQGRICFKCATCGRIAR